jgi:hypothetical protein
MGDCTGVLGVGGGGLDGFGFDAGEGYTGVADLGFSREESGVCGGYTSSRSADIS